MAENPELLCLNRSTFHCFIQLRILSISPLSQEEDVPISLLVKKCGEEKQTVEHKEPTGLETAEKLDHCSEICIWGQEKEGPCSS